MGMKNLMLICILLLGASTLTLAQERMRVTTSDEELIVMDEDALVNALVRLTNQNRETEQANALAETLELARLQLLFNLFSHAEPTDSYIAPTAKGSSTVEVQPSSSSNRLIEQRLTNLEALITQLLMRQPQQSLSIVQSPQQPEPKQVKPIVIQSAPIASTDSRDADRLAQLERRLYELLNTPKVEVAQPLADNQVEASSTIVRPEVVTKIVTDTIRVESRELVLVPADFKRSVYFKVGSAQLDNKGQDILRNAVTFLKRYPEAKLCIEGFASPDGQAERNERLAAQRLEAVSNFFEREGIASSRLVQGLPTIDRTASGLQLARRVDLSLVR